MMKIMDSVDPVVAGGTFSGNLFGCAAGIEAIKQLWSNLASLNPGSLAWMSVTQISKPSSMVKTSPPSCGELVARLASTLQQANTAYSTNEITLKGGDGLLIRINCRLRKLALYFI